MNWPFGNREALVFSFEQYHFCFSTSFGIGPFYTFSFSPTNKTIIMYRLAIDWPSAIIRNNFRLLIRSFIHSVSLCASVIATVSVFLRFPSRLSTIFFSSENWMTRRERRRAKKIYTENCHRTFSCFDEVQRIEWVWVRDRERKRAAEAAATAKKKGKRKRSFIFISLGWSKCRQQQHHHQHRHEIPFSYFSSLFCDSTKFLFSFFPYIGNRSKVFQIFT